MTKFNKGDKVVLGPRTPKELLAQVRNNRKRTITSIYYDHKRKCRYFYLGINNRGPGNGAIECYPFRSYMLDAVIARGPGRPRTKRKYNRHMSNPTHCPNAPVMGLIGEPSGCRCNTSLMGGNA